MYTCRGRETGSQRKGNFTLNTIDYIRCVYPSSSPLPPSHPQRQKNLKDVMKAPTSIILSSPILETCASKAKKKNIKKLFQILFFPRHWEFKDLYEKRKKTMGQNYYSVFNFDSRRRRDARGRGILVWRRCFSSLFA